MAHSWVYNWVVARASVVIAILSLIASLTVHAQTLVRDTSAQSIGGVNDVTGGLTYLLQNDDLLLLQVNPSSQSSFSTSLIGLDTTNSSVSGQKTISTTTTDAGTSFETRSGVLAAEGTGRMYQTPSDMVVVLNEADGPAWQVTLTDPYSQFTSTVPLTSRFSPSGTVYTQVVFGNFKGDGLVEPLLFYASTQSGGQYEYGMKVIAPEDSTKEDTPLQGPEFFAGGNLNRLPIVNTIVVGDFNNDGRDEIAALLNDNQTIAFFSVDPKTLAITLTQTIVLPYPMVANQATLAAGRFRDCGGTGCLTNADLVVVGQIYKKPNGYSVIPIKVTPGTTGNGSFTAQIVRNPNAPEDTPFYRFPDYHAAYGVLAEAATLANAPRQTLQQLVIGIKILGEASYIQIGRFFQNPNEQDLSTFYWDSSTTINGIMLTDMHVGNFDNLDTDGKTYNPAPQIAINTTNGFGNYTLQIFDIVVPDPFPPIPGQKPADWLSFHKGSTYNYTGSLAGSGLVAVIPGDIQARSLRLGSPDIVQIPSHIQPDIVLAIPPMHADWVNPITKAVSNYEPGCAYYFYPVPCQINLTVFPSAPPSVSTGGFSTAFNFGTNSKSEGKQASTTSWGVSVKHVSEGTVTYGDGLSGSSLSFKNTLKYAHDETVKKFRTCTLLDYANW